MNYNSKLAGVVIVFLSLSLFVFAQVSVRSLMDEGASLVKNKKFQKAIKSYESAEELLKTTSVSSQTKIELYTQLHNLYNKGLTRKKAAFYLEKLTQEKLKLKNRELQSKNQELQNKDSVVVSLEEQYEQQTEISEFQSEQIENLERSQLIGKMRSFEDSLRIAFKNSEIREKESQVALEKAKREQTQSIALGVAAVLGLIIVLFIMNIRSNKVIATEKKKSEELLRNILPASIAQELKDKGSVSPQKHRDTSVLFADFIGFSKVAEVLDQNALVALIDEYFRVFDEIIKRNGVEKIKTIGDAYMCVSGVPNVDSNHALNMMKAAIEIQVKINELRELKTLKNEPYFDLRIGIQSGEVIAGVVGRDKYAYDIWGKAVNLASRIESVCPPGCVAISKETKALLGEKYKFSEVIRMDVKNTKNVEAHIFDLN